MSKLPFTENRLILFNYIIYFRLLIYFDISFFQITYLFIIVATFTYYYLAFYKI